MLRRSECTLLPLRRRRRRQRQRCTRARATQPFRRDVMFLPIPRNQIDHPTRRGPGGSVPTATTSSIECTYHRASKCKHWHRNWSSAPKLFVSSLHTVWLINMGCFVWRTSSMITLLLDLLHIGLRSFAALPLGSGESSYSMFTAYQRKKRYQAGEPILYFILQPTQKVSSQSNLFETRHAPARTPCQDLSARWRSTPPRRSSTCRIGRWKRPRAARSPQWPE